ncbi:dTDP-4-dehydrorhamnose reductase [Hymenobacter roseosalivarius DSM 11622]|uniref:dTDP-4-dehydrorhamnose reductase n=1 Tax=Hymenobacter roseosalivarius DSM 11622 TaxID=645990 RepID=A0A1W1VTN9_9BACT|nr:SDR family oxidoreductase [Hymenobacter roseosalivarius]SMB96735.1 dTDP-4-dehydrorhamnose reductase [Hymenobacter roseosalivarius DSM 11622]
MRILLTGSNGLLGQKLVELLRQQQGVEIIATSRGANKLAAHYPDLRFVPLDVTDRAQVQLVLGTEKPTHVIHTAAMTNVDECELNREPCWLQNVTAVEHLVAACEQHQAHLTHVSTDFIFSGKKGPLTEEEVPAPINFYGESKLAAEQAVQASKGSWAIVRTVLVYGIVHDYGRTNIVLWVRDSLRAGKQINVVDDQFRTPTLAEDLAQGCWLVARQDATGVYNISSSELLTPYQMALQVADYFALDKSLIVKADGSTFTQPAKRPPRTGFIITKAQRDLGYKPHTFQEGIALLARQTEEA